MCFEPRHKSFFSLIWKHILFLLVLPLFGCQRLHITHSRISRIRRSYLWTCSKSFWKISTNWSEGRQQVQQKQLYHTDSLSKITVSDYIFLWYKGAERFTQQQSAHLSFQVLLCTSYSACFWWAVQCAQSRRPASWVQWCGCIHLRNMKCVCSRALGKHALQNV